MTKENKQQTNLCVMDDLIPLSKWNEKFSYPSSGAIRQYIYYADRYNFHNITKRVGNRIYISISAFNAWVENQNKAV